MKKRKVTKEELLNKSTGKKKTPIIIVGAAIMLAVVICIGIVYDGLHKDPLITIDNKVYDMEDMMFYIYATEMQYNSIASFYEQIGSTTDYWEEEASEGITNREQAKDDVMYQAIQVTLLYNEAKKAGYSLTSEEKESVSTNAKETYENMNATQKRVTGLTRSKLKTAYTMATIADRYRTDTIDGFDIDDAALTAEVSKEDFRQYDIQYYTALKTTTDEEGNATDLPDSELEEIKADMEELLATAKTAEDFTKLLPEDTEGNPISYGSSSFIETDTPYTEEVRNAVKALANDEISGVLETDTAYFFFKMIDNNSTDRYESEVESKITTEENTKFEEWFENLKSEHNIVIDEAEWSGITLGNISNGGDL